MVMDLLGSSPFRSEPGPQNPEERQDDHAKAMSRDKQMGGEPMQQAGSAVMHKVAGIKRRSKNIPQREDDFIRELRQFMKEQYYTQSDLATSLNCSQAKISHFLCCYMSNKAHARMVKLVKSWQETADHSRGWPARARRTSPAQQGEDASSDQQHDLQPDTQLDNACSPGRTRTESTSSSECSDSFSDGTTPARVDSITPSSAYGSDSTPVATRPTRHMLVDKSSIASLAPKAPPGAKKTMGETRKRAHPAHEDSASTPPLVARQTRIKMVHSASPVRMGDVGAAQWGPVNMSGSCVDSLGHERRRSWCHGCLYTGSCLNELTAEDVALAQNLVNFSRGAGLFSAQPDGGDIRILINSPLDTKCTEPWVAMDTPPSVGQPGSPPSRLHMTSPPPMVWRYAAGDGEYRCELSNGMWQ